MWAFAPWRTLELVAPGFFGGRPGGPAAPVYVALGGGGPSGIPFVTSAFVGAVLLALSASGSRTMKSGSVVAGAALLSLWIAFGPWLGAEPLLRHVPIWGAFRYSEKLLGPFTLCVAVLAALGADRIAASPRRGASVIAGAAAACGLGAALLLAVPATEALFRREGPVGVASLARERLGIGLLHAAIALAAFSALRLVSSSPLVKERFAAIVAALVLAQSFAASPFALHAGPAGARAPRSLEWLHQGAVPAPIEVPVPEVSAKRPFEREEFERLSAVESRMGVPSYNVASRVDGIDPYQGVKPLPFMRVRAALEEAFGPRQISTAWRRFAVTHVAVGPNTDAASRETASLAVAGGVPAWHDAALGISIFEVPSAMGALRERRRPRRIEGSRATRAARPARGRRGSRRRGSYRAPPRVRPRPVDSARCRARTGRGGVVG